MPEEIIAPEAGENASKIDNQPVAPTEAPNGEKEAEIKEDIDPRIVGIIGEEKIKSAYGESKQPKEEAKPAEGEEKKDTPPEKEGGENQENEEKEEEVKLPAMTPPEPKPTRLDRRLASRYIRNLHLQGETEIPTEEEILEDLKKYSKEEKIQALKHHLYQEKRLRGEKPTGNDFEEEDVEAIQDAEREAVRQEILAEEHEKRVMRSFVEFVDNHTELLPDTPENKKEFQDKKAYNPILAKAVETLFQGGMPISEAYETVTAEIKAVKEAQDTKAEKEKNAALSGVLSGTGQSHKEDKELDWDDVKRISEEDPQLYKSMLAQGKFRHLM